MIIRGFISKEEIMKGYPKYLNTKQDFINVIRDDMDRVKTREHLQALLNTAKRKEPVWPEGYSPGNPPGPEEPPVEPLSWKEVDNPGGAIFLKGFTMDEVKGMVEVVEEILPFRDQILDLKAAVYNEAYADANARRGSLDLESPWLPETVKIALSDTEPLADLEVEEKDAALSEINGILSQIQTVIEERLDIV